MQTKHVPSYNEGIERYVSPEGFILPGVTRILAAEGLKSSYVPPDHMMLFGRYVHLVTELWDKGILDEASVSPQLQPALAAWKKFLTTEQPEMIGIEQPLYHPLFLYMGIVDRIVRIGKKIGPLDIKSGKPESWHSYQLAGYVPLIEAAYSIKCTHVFSCYLSGGNYVSKVQPADTGKAVWEAARVLYQTKHRIEIAP